MEIPKNISLIEVFYFIVLISLNESKQAAGIPEAWITAYLLLSLGAIKQNDYVTVYAGASGVGTAAIQLIKHFKAKSIITCSSDEKCEYTKK